MVKGLGLGGLPPNPQPFRVQSLGLRVWGDMQWFRGGLVFKAHRLLHYSILGSRVIKKKKKAEG